MFRRENGSRGGTATLTVAAWSAFDASGIVLEVGAELTARLWPASPEVVFAEPLPSMCYSERDFRRLMEILLGRAMSAMPPDMNPRAAVAARCEEHTVLVSVRSGEAGVFRNGGHFWVDDKFGSGAVAYFTAHA